MSVQSKNKWTDEECKSYVKGKYSSSTLLLNNKISISSMPRFSGLGEITLKEEGGEEGKVGPTDS